MRQRRARTFGPLGMSTSSACRQPTKGRSSSRRPSRTGRSTSCSMRFITSTSTSGDGAKAPIPSVAGPRSWCMVRFWSCTAAGITEKRTPSETASTETSAPLGHSSSAASSTGGSAVATPRRWAKAREKLREASISDAACEGPKTGTPPARSTSARPSASSCSEPMTAKATLRSLQKSLTSLNNGGVRGTSTGMRGAESLPEPPSVLPLLKACWPSVPPLPGAT
mmetsp:Transcript_56347/g.159940  ORF Transcript_56347/g.159940 Transcript_56347/m.159940 type:complete len:224 (+) Transcript_56347:2632-3303(+)